MTAIIGLFTVGTFFTIAFFGSLITYHVHYDNLYDKNGERTNKEVLQLAASLQ